jgi:hypothetical protein
VPLSDHEQRLLEQMERALYQEDPKFASSLRSGRSGSMNRSRIVVGSVGVILGLVVVVGGVATAIPPLGVLGFALMVAGAFWAWNGARGEPATVADSSMLGSAPPVGAKLKDSHSPFMSKMEQRWRNRREGDGHS